MAKTDWRFTDTVIPEDLNGIGEEINGLRTEISTRFDHADTTPLTLQPGLQVVHAEKDARFKLGEIRGRTLVNLLGYHGNLDTLNNWYVVIGTGNAQGRIATVTGNGTGRNPQMQSLFSLGPKPAIGDKFFLTAKIRVDSPDCTALRIYLYVNSIGIQDGGRVVNPEVGKEYIVSGIVTVTQEMIDVWDTLKFVVSAWYSNDTTANNSVTKFWDLAMYPVPTVDHSLTNEELQGKYPYTNGGITGIDNPYVINTSGNLLPPFYEWTLNSFAEGKVKFNSPYEVSVQANGVLGQYEQLSYSLLGQPGLTYTIRKEGTVNRINVRFYDSSDTLISNVTNSGSGDSDTITFTTPSDTVKITVLFNSTVAGTFTLENPMLVVGAEAKPFLPQRKSMLAFQTELHANPLDGSDPDILFEENGEYWKLVKWKKVVLDGSLNWLYGSGETGYKWANLPLTGQVPDSGHAIKFDGTLLNRRVIVDGIPGSGPNRHALRDNLLIITIANSDSGWGDDYTPTQDEIKAYFMGFKMMISGQARSSIYNGEGQKGWVRIYDYVTNPALTTFYSTVLTQVLDYGPTWYDNDKTRPYQLLYRLAKETVEPVVTEGSLLLSEGDNMVEVGTGIVLRERTTPVKNGSTIVYHFVNRTNFPGSLLKNKTREILHIYGNNKDQTALWSRIYDDVANGLVRATFGNVTQEFDPSAAYSVTYIKLDKSPIQPITGTLAANEKAQIGDLTAGVAEALQRVSVVEQKKADEDAQGWITPTLLNGALQGGTPVRYKKMPDGTVRFIGIFVPKVSGLVFKLPVGCQPKDNLRIPIVSFAADGTIIPSFAYINPNGDAGIGVFGNNYVSFDGVSFLAEQ